MASRAVLDLIVTLQDEASRGLDRIGASAASVGKNLAKIGGAAAIGGIAAIGAAAGKAAFEGLGFNNTMEQVTAQLNAFTKDGAASAEILDMIRDRASRTPFAFEEMAKATAGLLPVAKSSGAALEDLVAQAEILAASNPAEGLEGAAFALREAASGDFASIIERFNLSRQTLNRLKEEGVPALEAVQIAMQEMGYDASLVTNMAETMSGRWSTFKDTLVGFAATATEGLFAGLSEGLARVNEMLSDPAVLEWINGVATAIGDRLTGAFNALVGFVERAVGAFASLRDAFQAGELFTVFEDGSSTIGWFLEQLGLSEGVATRVGAAISTMGTAVQSGLQLAKDAVTTFRDAFAGEWVDSEAVHPFHRIAGALGTLAGKLAETDFPALIREIMPDSVVQAWDTVTGKIEDFQKLISMDVEPLVALKSVLGEAFPQTLVDAISTIVGKFEDFQKLISMDVEPLVALKAVMGEAFPQTLVDAVTGVADGMGNLAGSIKAFVEANPELVRDVLVGIGAALTTLAVLSVVASGMTALAAAMTAAATAGGILAGVMAAVLSPIGLITIAVGLLAAAWHGNWGGIQEKTQAVYDAINPTFIEIERWINENLPKAIDWLKTKWDENWVAISEAVSREWAAFQKDLDAIGTYFTETIPGNLRDMKAAWDRDWAALGSKVSEIVENIKGYFDIDWSAIGADVVNGIKSGITGGIASLEQAARDAATGMLNAAKNALNIESPSRVMAEQVGLPIAQGIAAGMLEGEGAIEGAMNHIAAALARGENILTVFEDGSSILEGFLKKLGMTAGAAAEASLFILGYLDDLREGIYESFDPAMIADIIGNLAGGYGPGSVLDKGIAYIVEQIKSVPGAIAGAASATAAVLPDAMQDAQRPAATATDELVANVVQAFADTHWRGIGHEIINGIAAGITEGITVLQSAARAAADAALAAMQDTLGITSPSKVMAEKVGVPMGEGVVLGFQRALQGLSAPLAAPSLTYGMAAAGGPVGASGGVSTTNVFHIDARGSTMSESQFRRVIEQVVDEKAGRADQSLRVR